MHPLRVLMAVLVSIASVTAAHAAEPPAASPSGARQQSKIIIPASARAAYDTWGYAPAVVTPDGTVYVSGVVVMLQGEGSYAQRYAAGFKRAMQEIEAILKEAGSSLDDVVDITTYHTDMPNQLDTAVKVRREMMSKPHPAWTAVGTTALAIPDAVTEIRVIAKLVRRSK